MTEQRPGEGVGNLGLRLRCGRCGADVGWRFRPLLLAVGTDPSSRAPDAIATALLRLANVADVDVFSCVPCERMVSEQAVRIASEGIDRLRAEIRAEILANGPSEFLAEEFEKPKGETT